MTKSANHYQVLGVTFSSTQEEIRRAYRVLARRYHPDLNPGQPSSEDTFKRIAAAYQVLSDERARQRYDAELEGSSFYHDEYQRATRQSHARTKKSRPAAASAYQQHATGRPMKQKPAPQAKRGKSIIEKLTGKLSRFSKKMASSRTPEPAPVSFSVLEISLDIRDALFGTKKTIEIPLGQGTKKLSVQFPPGLRDGSTIPLSAGPHDQEQGIIIIRIAPHPFLSLQRKGLVYEVPITIAESFAGGQFVIPGIDEPLSIRIPPGACSGDELRLVGKGSFLKDGSRGDLFIRFMIVSPEAPDAVGVKDLARAFEGYYGKNPRDKFPKALFE